MILTRVLLPAPFSPSSAWISPGWMKRSTESLATQPGNVLVTPSRASSGAAWAGSLIALLLSHVLVPHRHGTTLFCCSALCHDRVFCRALEDKLTIWSRKRSEWGDWRCADMVPAVFANEFAPTGGCERRGRIVGAASAANRFSGCRCLHPSRSRMNSLLQADTNAVARL